MVSDRLRLPRRGGPLRTGIFPGAITGGLFGSVERLWPRVSAPRAYDLRVRFALESVTVDGVVDVDAFNYRVDYPPAS